MKINDTEVNEPFSASVQSLMDSLMNLISVPTSLTSSPRLILGVSVITLSPFSTYIAIGAVTDVL
ncbi:hypothetical protein ACFL6G_06335 [candidate division KSB1 bacterium]